MSLKHGLLGLLNYGTMTGYELDKAFKFSLNLFWQAQTSQVYRELTAMEKAGWLTSEIHIQTGKPNKKLYTITDAGRAELMAWLAKDSADSGLIFRSEFLLRLFFSGERSAAENMQALKAFKAQAEQALAHVADTGSSIDSYRAMIGDSRNAKAVYWALTARFGTAYMHMCIDFAESAIRALEEQA